MIRTEATSRVQLNQCLEQHAETIRIPMDDMWESLIIPSGNHFKILLHDKIIGYFIIDDGNFLLQFYICEDCELAKIEIFNLILNKAKIKGAFAGTYEPEYLSFCLKIGRNTEIDTILYHARDFNPLSCPVDNVMTSIGSIEDYDAVLKFCRSQVGLEGDWMETYYQNLLPKGCIHFFKLNDELIGIGELRPSQSYTDYANLGIMVSKDWREKQLGSYIMNQILIKAKEMGLTGICSTTSDNIASQKAINRAGLIPYHRILKITF